MADDDNFTVELGVLTEIFGADQIISAGGPRTVGILITPQTAADAAKFVQLEAHFNCGTGYPDQPPIYELRAPKGLSQAQLDGLHSALDAEAETLAGEPMLFSLIELIRDSLTESNMPSDHCAICLGQFTDPAAIFVTDACFHYFHRGCLLGYLAHLDERDREAAADKVAPPKAWTDQRPCPVCRTDTTLIASAVRDGNVAAGGDDDGLALSDVLTPALRAAQQARAQVYRRQSEIGGLIDESPKQVLSLREGAAPIYTANGPAAVPVQPAGVSRGPRPAAATGLTEIGTKTKIETKIETKIAPAGQAAMAVGSAGSEPTPSRPKPAQGDATRRRRNRGQGRSKDTANGGGGGGDSGSVTIDGGGGGGGGRGRSGGGKGGRGTRRGGGKGGRGRGRPPNAAQQPA